MLRHLAVQSLLHDRGKLAAALIGVIFSVVLVNVQGGLFLGLIRKASILIERSDADIWVGHRGMHNVDLPHSIPERWETRIASVEGVNRVEKLRMGFSEMSLPDGGFEGVTVVGWPTGKQWDRQLNLVAGDRRCLNRPDAVVVDGCDDLKLQSPGVGEVREIGGRRVQIAGHSYGVLSFLITPYVFTTFRRAAELTPVTHDQTSYFLVHVDKPDDAPEICRRIESRLPGVSAMTADRFSWVSVHFWMTRTGLGISFGAATLLGLLIGWVMVGQTLYAMVLDRVREFATLKAIGAGERDIIGVLMTQSLAVALIGIAAGIGISLTLQRILSTPQADIRIPATLLATSAATVLLICLAASVLPYLRVRRVDPHSILAG